MIHLSRMGNTVGELDARARELGFDNLSHAARLMGEMFGVFPNVQAMRCYQDKRGKISQFMVLTFLNFFRVIELEKEVHGV